MRLPLLAATALLWTGTAAAQPHEAKAPAPPVAHAAEKAPAKAPAPLDHVRGRIATAVAAARMPPRRAARSSAPRTPAPPPAAAPPAPPRVTLRWPEERLTITWTPAEDRVFVLWPR